MSAVSLSMGTGTTSGNPGETGNTVKVEQGANVDLVIHVDGEEKWAKKFRGADDWVVTCQEAIGTYIVCPPEGGKVISTLPGAPGTAAKRHTWYYFNIIDNKWSMIRPICITADRLGRHRSFEYMWENICIPGGVLKINLCS